ncbi:hypothetical protein [Flavobacterium sp. MMS24-S5]|uniref:hypothetical protein n=1 Tax=Flavobacterium sp. MMS24-S5 TaxID=3416605 RepID=UPI003D04B266
MPTITFEDYKKAIKAKYEEEKNGEYSNNLNSPTSANLRNLCIKRFETNNSKDDLITFKSFFDFPFDRDNRNLYGEIELNKLTAVRRFLLNVTESPAEDTVQLAAILVDLQPRPFKEFQKQLDPDEVKLIEELRDTNHDKNRFFSDILPDKVETEKFPELKNDEVEKDKNEETGQDEAEEVQDENEDLEKNPTGIFTPIKKGGGDGGSSRLKRSLIIASFSLRSSFNRLLKHVKKRLHAMDGRSL